MLRPFTPPLDFLDRLRQGSIYAPQEDRNGGDSPCPILSIRDHLVLLHLLVQLTLERAHADLDDLLHLIRQLALHVLLQPPQHERSEHLVQTPDDEERLFFVQLDLAGGAGVGEGRVEPFVERFYGVEDLGKGEIEERP